MEAMTSTLQGGTVGIKAAAPDNEREILLNAYEIV
jgi:hypothetical protein